MNNNDNFDDDDFITADIESFSAFATQKMKECPNASFNKLLSEFLKTHQAVSNPKKVQHQQ